MKVKLSGLCPKSRRSGSLLAAFPDLWEGMATEVLRDTQIKPSGLCPKRSCSSLFRSLEKQGQHLDACICQTDRFSFPQDPGKGKTSPAGLFAGAAAMFQLRLLEVYLALPNANAFHPEHETLSKLCARSLRGMSSCIATGKPHVSPARLNVLACITSGTGWGGKMILSKYENMHYFGLAALWLIALGLPSQRPCRDVIRLPKRCIGNLCPFCLLFCFHGGVAAECSCINPTGRIGRGSEQRDSGAACGRDRTPPVMPQLLAGPKRNLSTWTQL